MCGAKKLTILRRFEKRSAILVRIPGNRVGHLLRSGFLRLFKGEKGNEEIRRDEEGDDDEGVSTSERWQISSHLRLQRGGSRIRHALHAIFRLFHYSLLLVGLHGGGLGVHVVGDGKEHTFMALLALLDIFSRPESVIVLEFLWVVWVMKSIEWWGEESKNDAFLERARGAFYRKNGVGDGKNHMKMYFF